MAGEGKGHAAHGHDDDGGGPESGCPQDDPRFASPLPGADEFANPFVENTKVIREWKGESAGDQFGWIARDIGDVNRDGIHDIVTSAPTSNVGGAGAGRVYVYSTRSGKLVWKVDGRPGDLLGTGIEAAGDTNGDGTPDVVASAPGGGRAYIYSGRDGAVLQAFDAEDKQDAFGRHVSGVGDVNGDGAADVIVGAPPTTPRGKGPAELRLLGTGRQAASDLDGRAPKGMGSAVPWPAVPTGNACFSWSVRQRPGQREPGAYSISERWAGRRSSSKNADESGAALGAMFLSVPGDVNGDAVPDLYVTDFPNSAKGPATGRAYLYSARTERLC